LQFFYKPKDAGCKGDKVIVPKQVRDKLFNEDAMKNQCWYSNKSFSDGF